MKKITIIILLFAMTLISVFLSRFLADDWLDFLSKVGNLITLFSTIVTLIIALILFNQLGLDQAILEKKAIVVFELLELLNERNFKIQTGSGLNPIIWLTTINKYQASYIEFGTTKLAFKESYLDYIDPILLLANNVFLPKEILPKIQALAPFSTFSLGSEMNEYAKVFPGRRSVEAIKNIEGIKGQDEWLGLLYSHPTPSEINLSDFINRWCELIIAVTNWLETNSSYQDLNIPFSRLELHERKRNLTRKLWEWLMKDAF